MRVVTGTISVRARPSTVNRTPSSGSGNSSRKKLTPPAFAAASSEWRAMLLTVNTVAISAAIGIDQEMNSGIWYR